MITNNKRLELEWVGKDVHPRLEPRILIEDTDYSSHASHRISSADIFDNILIHGDNLLAIKSLQQQYSNSVKCIVIDPPYNTGSAFAHYDDGIEHSLWLSMFRDRVELLGTLLSDDGSFWIMLDDTEMHYAKVVLDMVLGRNNFISTVIWQKKYTQANDAVFFSDNHDFVLVYAKRREKFSLKNLPRSEKQNAAYRNPDGDVRGPWKATPLHAKSGRDSAFTYTFRNGVHWSPPTGTFPRFSTDTLQKMDEAGAIWFGSNGKAVPSRKTYLSEVQQSIVPTSIWMYDEVGHNHEARTEARELIPTDPFSTPKPERLIQRILTLATSAGDLVLDSFLGSGTTAAVAHKMGRRWIGIELGEHAITHCVPRLRKVIDGSDQGGISTSVGWKGGGGFRFYRLAPSLLERDKWGNWVISREYDAGMLAEAMCKHEGFIYAPSDSVYWQQGHSTETDFIFTTTQSLTHDQLAHLSEEVGEGRTLLVCCSAFRANIDAFENLTVRKIPNAVLHRCEFGHDDYSLEVNNLPAAPIDEPEPIKSNGKHAGKDEATLEMDFIEELSAEK
jgi:adenine-specific DNA-methyltransferase